MKKLIVLLLVLCSVTSCGWKKSSKQVVLAPQKCGIATLNLHDEVRNRPLITEVWYPIDSSIPAQSVKGLWVRCPEARNAPIAPFQEKYPLVVMSHGNGGDRMNISWLAEVLASNGYIVAAVDHHGNTWNNKIAECFIKIWERPRDVSAMIDKLLQNTVFGSHIDSDRIGFIGYSLGGLTGVWIAGGKLSKIEKSMIAALPKDQLPPDMTPELLEAIDFSAAEQSYEDPRVGAVFLMAPALGQLVDPESLQSIEVPIYITAAENDDIAPYESNGKVLSHKIKKAICTLIPGGASHYVFLNEASQGGKLLLDRMISQDAPSISRRKIHDDIATAALQFFEDSLK